MYKIGYTKRDVTKRIKELKTGNGNEIFLVDSFESEWASKIETALHRKYKSKLADGEWFRLDEADVFLFHESCKRVEDMLKLVSTPIEDLF